MTDQRLLAMRLSVLAAEVADPERYRRGRVYARNGSVTDLQVRRGEVRGSVQGSRAQPYQVVLMVHRASGGRAGTGWIPSRGELAARCSCPDDVPACKHSVAVLLRFAERVADRPDLLALWLDVDQAKLLASSPGDGDGPDADTGPEGAGGEWDAFFGRREAWSGEFADLLPLADPVRPIVSRELDALALDGLDQVMRTLHSLYG